MYTMKILPINLNIYNITPIKLLKPAENKRIQPNPYISDSLEISFKGNDFNLDGAKQSSGVHCPTCGVEMLTEKEYEKLLQKAAKVETTQDFTNLLNEYKNNVPNGMRSILRSSGNEAYINNVDFHEHIQKLKKQAFLKHKSKVEAANNYLREFAKTLPPDEEKKVTDVLGTISPIEKHIEYKRKVLPVLNSLNIDETKYFNVLNNTINSLMTSSQYARIFSIYDIENKSPAELSVYILSKIFARSLMDSSNISKIYDAENPNNEILQCKKCIHKSSSKTFLSPSTFENPEFKNNLKVYLMDIAAKNGNQDSSEFFNYAMYLNGFINKISKKEIQFTKEEIQEIGKLGKILSRHEEFTPIAQTKTDIPCAGCNSTLLPHSIKKEIEHELKHRSTIKGYVGILDQYEKYIGKYGKFAAKIIKETVESNPLITKNELLEIIQYKADQETDTQLNNVLNEFSKFRPYIYMHNPMEKVKKYDKISNRINNYITSGKLKESNYNYDLFVEEALNGINMNIDTPASVYTLLNRIKIACLKNSLVKPNEFDDEKDKDKIASIIYKIFNSNSATTDHLVARMHDGENEKNNLIGLCKTCNKHIKGKKQTFSWFVQNPEVSKNLLKQMQIIDRMAKNGEIEGYDEWAKNIADKMYELTYGKYDIRDKFK